MIDWKQIEAVVEQNMMFVGDDFFAGIRNDKRKELIITYIAAARNLEGRINWRQPNETPDAAVRRMVTLAAAAINKAGYALEKANTSIDENGVSTTSKVEYKSIQITEIDERGRPIFTFARVALPKGFVDADDYADAYLEALRDGKPEHMTTRSVFTKILG